ncbi:MAG: hypothetical protein MJZ03_03950 [archaeon]|nr:hypothetical protein [archaeon]
MSYDVTQIANLVNDAASDSMGKSVSITNLDSTGLASLGKQLASLNLLDGWFGSLAKRIAKTVYFVRSYEGSTRSILRSEEEYGAFVQKVYVDMPDAVDNPEWDIPNQSGRYQQHSPFDVEGTVTVSAVIFGGKGTWSVEVIMPRTQIKEAFLSPAAMMAFIDKIYIQIENKYKKDVEALVSLACNTAMADALNGGKSRNLLTEYNQLAGTQLTAAQALRTADFLKYANMEIGRTVKAMQEMSTIFNKAGYATFTDESNLVVEVLDQYNKASQVYAESDSFHRELIALPRFESVTAWQYLGHDGKLAFADCSKIDITHDDINSGEAVTQSGIIAFVHDIENVAAYFGDRDTWELENPRDRVLIHGEHATKGFAIDGHANAVVFYVA